MYNIENIQAAIDSLKIDLIDIESKKIGTPFQKKRIKNYILKLEKIIAQIKKDGKLEQRFEHISDIIELADEDVQDAKKNI